MTTIIADHKRGIMAADTRCTYAGTCFRIFKIDRVGEMLIGSAGDAGQGTAFVAWARNGFDDDPPQMDEIDVLVLKKSGILLYSQSPYPLKVELPFYAIGSGAQGALVALSLGMDPREAIEQVAQWDEATNGDITVKELGR